MNPTRELKRSFHRHRRRGLSEEDSTKFAVTELLSRLGLTVLPGEGLRTALERIDQLGVMGAHGRGCGVHGLPEATAGWWSAGRHVAAGSWRGRGWGVVKSSQAFRLREPQIAERIAMKQIEAASRCPAHNSGSFLV